MGERYDVTLQEVLAAILKEPDKGATLLLDVVDAKVQSGALEALEDGAAAVLKSKLVLGLQKIQEEGGEYVKFAGDLVDNATAAVEFILAKADQAIDAGAAEPLLDTLSAIAKDYAVVGLTGQQERLASIKLHAEA